LQACNGLELRFALLKLRGDLLPLALYKVRYPDLELGIFMSSKLVFSLHERLRKGGRTTTSGPNFHIDAAYEFSKFLYTGTAVFPFFLPGYTVLIPKVLRYKVVSSRFLDDIFLSSLFSRFTEIIFLMQGQYIWQRDNIIIANIL
jgi:hypothetical protein